MSPAILNLPNELLDLIFTFSKRNPGSEVTTSSPPPSSYNPLQNAMYKPLPEPHRSLQYPLSCLASTCRSFQPIAERINFHTLRICPSNRLEPTYFRLTNWSPSTAENGIHIARCNVKIGGCWKCDTKRPGHKRMERDNSEPKITMRFFSSPSLQVMLRDPCSRISAQFHSPSAYWGQHRPGPQVYHLMEPVFFGMQQLEAILARRNKRQCQTELKLDFQIWVNVDPAIAIVTPDWQDQLVRVIGGYGHDYRSLEHLQSEFKHLVIKPLRLVGVTEEHMRWLEKQKRAMVRAKEEREQQWMEKVRSKQWTVGWNSRDFVDDGQFELFLWTLEQEQQLLWRCAFASIFWCFESSKGEDLSRIRRTGKWGYSSS
ncbi:hypothetical protein BJ508DRAFT_308361 [Ascobolus immersus RN42]|uniref:Uncharacterized protein n=1 Tax=Ascobolus immersus RN42 TaxID=1160509 RepID=A0A3N4I5Q5_ASCIM|nr:hypothetical protein BJ508DRAFT_308361 [Ascobolus immersus RN42]